MLVHPTDKSQKERKCGTIYHITCNDDPQHTNEGELKRHLGVKFKEHIEKDKPTGVREHCLNTGHSVSITNTKVLEKELDWPGIDAK